MGYSETIKAVPIARASPEDVKPRTMMAMCDNLADFDRLMRSRR